MALKMSYHDVERDVTYTDAYWRLVHFSYSRERQDAELLFSAYSSENAAIDGRAPVATKAFRLTGEDFQQIDALLTAGFKGRVYDFAKTKQEPVGKDADGNDILRAFFADATDA